MRRSLLPAAALAAALHLTIFALADAVKRDAPPALVRAIAVQSVAPRAMVVAPEPPFEQPASSADASPRPAVLHAVPVTRPVAARKPVRSPEAVQKQIKAEAPREEPIPTYATSPPPAFVWSYRLRRDAQGGEAALTWQPEADRYTARLAGTLGARTAIDWSSSGGFDAAGIAPERFIVRDRSRAAHAANFRRTGEPSISYSGARVESPLPAGAQDRLSWIMQLAAIVSSEAARVAEDGRVELYVTGARGDAARWSFALIGHETIETGLGPVRAIRLLREAQRPYDTRAEVWLDPQRHHLPVRATLANFPAGQELELLVQSTHESGHRQP